MRCNPRTIFICQQCTPCTQTQRSASCLLGAQTRACMNMLFSRAESLTHPHVHGCRTTLLLLTIRHLPSPMILCLAGPFGQRSQPDEGDRGGLSRDCTDSTSPTKAGDGVEARGRGGGGLRQLTQQLLKLCETLCAAEEAHAGRSSIGGHATFVDRIVRGAPTASGSVGRHGVWRSLTNRRRHHHNPIQSPPHAVRWGARAVRRLLWRPAVDGGRIEIGGHRAAISL